MNGRIVDSVDCKCYLPCMRKILPAAVVTLLIFIVASQNLGVRYLWQDELETAERAKSILSYGLPKVIDDEGRISVNAGGREIEDGNLHRYTPWVQFYVGAFGLELGK